MISKSYICATNLPLQRRCHNLIQSHSTTPGVCSLQNNTTGRNSFLAAKPLVATDISTSVKTRRPLLTSCKASKKQQNNSNTAKDTSSYVSPFPELSDAIDNNIFRIWLPFAVAAGIVMYFDAAYSGDWSNIGVITEEQELQLQAFVPIGAGIHAVFGGVAGYLSKQRGEVSWLRRSIKTLALGLVGLVEVILLPEIEEGV